MLRKKAEMVVARSITAGLAVALSMWAAGAKAPAAHTAWGCPARTVAPGSLAPESLLRAVRREVPKTFHFTNQSGMVHLTPRTYSVVTTMSLSSATPAAGAGPYRKLATKRCGASVANDSWVVLLWFSTVQTAFDEHGVIFFAATPSGWTPWYHRP